MIGMKTLRQVSFFLALLSIAYIARAQSLPNVTNKIQSPGSWTDPSTGLMWAAQDSGKDLSWKKAIKYCHDLRLSGFPDWRLANLFELQGIYDSTANAPGLDGPHSKDPTTWHVKGNIFLTAYEWSSDYRKDDRGHPSGYVYYFDFNEGRSNDDPTGWPYSFSFRRALCVRGSGDPLGGQRRP